MMGHSYRSSTFNLVSKLLNFTTIYVVAFHSYMTVIVLRYDVRYSHGVSFVNDFSLTDIGESGPSTKV